jgi:heat shock protein HslJ
MLRVFTPILVLLLTACGGTDDPDDAGGASPAVPAWPQMSPTTSTGGDGAGTGALDGTRWVLTQLDGQDVATDRPITLMLDSSQLDGRAGCDLDSGYAGAWNSTPDGTITELRVYARGACAGAGAEIGNAYLDALETATRFHHSDERLELLDADDEVVLAYRPAVVDPAIEATDWTLVSLDGGALVEGTTITLTLNSRNAVGSSGCNSYGSVLAVVAPGVVSIGSVVSTAMACADPNGVMEQEASYQARIGEVVAYHVSDDRLELRNAAGETTLVFQRALHLS